MTVDVPQIVTARVCFCRLVGVIFFCKPPFKRAAKVTLLNLELFQNSFAIQSKAVPLPHSFIVGDVANFDQCVGSN